MILNQNCLFLKKNTFKVSSFRSIFETVHSRWYPFNSVFLRVIPQDSFWYIFCFGRRDIFCLRLSEENYPKVNLVPDVPDISILCRRTEEVPRTSIKSEFLPRKKKTLLCCGRNSISYQSRYHFQIKKQNSVVSIVVFRGKWYFIILEFAVLEFEILSLCYESSTLILYKDLSSPIFQSLSVSESVRDREASRYR